MKVSVVIPVYNKEMRLRACLDSVLAQSFADFEVICVNDGSTDSSSDILKEYGLRDRRIKVISQENTGVSVARNVGIDATQGESLCFVDADDTIATDFLKTLASRATEADIVECSLFREEKPWKGEELLRYVDTTGRSLQGTAIWGKLYSADFVRRNSLRFPAGVRFGEDTEFNLAAWAAAESILDLPYSGYQYFNEGCKEYRLSAREITRKIDALTEGYARISRRFGQPISISRDVNITLSMYPLDVALDDDSEYRSLFTQFTPGATDKDFYSDGRCSPLVRTIIAVRNLVKAGKVTEAKAILHKGYKRYGHRFLSASYPYITTAIHGRLVGLGLLGVSLKLMQRI